MRWSIGLPRRTAFSLADSPSPSKAPRGAREGRWWFLGLTGASALFRNDS